MTGYITESAWVSHEGAPATRLIELFNSEERPQTLLGSTLTGIPLLDVDAGGLSLVIELRTELGNSIRGTEDLRVIFAVPQENVEGQDESTTNYLLTWKTLSEAEEGDLAVIASVGAEESHLSFSPVVQVTPYGLEETYMPRSNPDETSSLINGFVVNIQK